MIRRLAPFLSGILFAAGLLVSGMTQPAKVIAFLDFFGKWDPSLAFVMAGAVLVTSATFRILPRVKTGNGSPDLPDRRAPVTLPLVVGSALFGVGWGLSGLCPGPAIVSLVNGDLGTVLFVVGMVGGMSAHRKAREWHASTTPATAVPAPPRGGGFV